MNSKRIKLTFQFNSSTMDMHIKLIKSFPLLVQQLKRGSFIKQSENSRSYLYFSLGITYTICIFRFASTLCFLNVHICNLYILFINTDAKLLFHLITVSDHNNDICEWHFFNETQIFNLLILSASSILLIDKFITRNPSC